jgi:hypothetical protein
MDQGGLSTPKPKLSATIREQIGKVRAKLERLEEERAQKTEEDYRWFKNFFTHWIEELEEWLELAKFHENDPESLDEWMESVEEDLKACLNKRTIH